MIDFNIQPLLQNDEGKDFTGAIIFFTIWAIIALLSQYGKWQQKRRQREQSGPPAPSVPPPVPQRPRIPPQPRIEQPRRVEQPQRPHPPKVQKRLPRTQPPPPRPAPAPREVSIEIARPAPPSARAAVLADQMSHEIGASSERSRFKATVSLEGIRQDLKDPRALRKQFVVMELLQAPLSVRDQQR